MYGTVVDGGKPVEGANIVVDAKAFGLGSLEAITDSNGNWTVSFEIPDDQEFGLWPVEVSVAYGAGSMMYTLMIQVGEVEKDDDVETVESEVEPLKERISELEARNQELEAENQMLQGRIQELEEEIQSLQETSSGVSYGTLGIVVSGVVVICLAVFAIMYQRSSQRSNRSTI